IYTELSDLLDVFKDFPFFTGINSYLLEEMSLVCPAFYMIYDTVNFLLFCFNKFFFCVRRVDIIQYQDASGLQSRVNVTHNPLILGWVIEIAETGEEAKDIIEITLAKRDPHIMPIE